jgi:hypothetical protein
VLPAWLRDQVADQDRRRSLIMPSMAGRPFRPIAAVQQLDPDAMRNLALAGITCDAQEAIDGGGDA